MILRAGSNRTDSGGDYYIVVEKAIKHPLYQKFNYDYYDYDFVLLKLTNPLDFSDAIKPITLPNEDLTVPDGAMCEVSGWGKYYYCKFYVVENVQLIILLNWNENRSYTKSE